MNQVTIYISAVIMLIFLSATNKENGASIIERNAVMPSVTKDKQNALHLVFAKGNQVWYKRSDNGGLSFSSPSLIDSIKNLVAVAGRGPQITATNKGLCMLAINKEGNIFAYTKQGNEKWQKPSKVNDVTDVAKEGFFSFASFNDSIFAVWLDLRNDSHNKIAGALSADGGKTWSKNKIVYQSPQGTVCECCKPSVIFTGQGITVMFRNFLDGNRDLYTTHSTNGAASFSAASKLGSGNWKLNGCPMDGGSLKETENGEIETVWRRMDTIFSCKSGSFEQAVGKGRNAGMEIVNNQFAYSWIDDGKIVCLLPNGKKEIVGEGILPQLQAVNKNTLICVWQKDNNIYSKLINL